MFVSANDFSGGNVPGCRFGFPGSERRQLDARILKLHFRSQVDDVLVLARSDGADSEVVRAVIDSASRHEAEHEVFVLGFLADQHWKEASPVEDFRLLQTRRVEKCRQNVDVLDHRVAG